MHKKESLIHILSCLWRELSPRRHMQFIGIFVLMMISAFAEMANIGAILSFLTALTAPESLIDNPYLRPILHFANIQDSKQLLLFVAISFALITGLTNGLRLAVVWGSTRLSFGAGADLSSKAYRSTLYQPYEVHISRNTSEILNGVGKVNEVVVAINLVFNLLSSSIMIVAILIAIIAVEPLVALGATIGFGLIYVGVIGITKNKLLQNSRRVASESTRVIKALQEGLGGIRDILIDGSQEIFCETYQNSSARSRRAQGNIEIIKASPRYIVESLGIALILILSYLIAVSSESVSKVIPVLGALGLASQRLLPVLQGAYTSWSGIRGMQASLIDALTILQQPIKEYQMSPMGPEIKFEKKIELINLSFQYGRDGAQVISGVNFEILKGDRIGIIGTTGGGKSTLLDIVMGLLRPTSGEVRVDGIAVSEVNAASWMRHIAHVPQAIYLSDSSIEENIAFGVPIAEIDPARVRSAAMQAHISNAIESWPNKYNTIVGERGVRLSGGQRQRIGIARALYKNADVIIFDEATSALDNETEAGVMAAIEELSESLTILMIAHRVTTLRGCTKIIELDSGQIKRVASYDEIMRSTVR